MSKTRTETELGENINQLIKFIWEFNYFFSLLLTSYEPSKASPLN